MTRPQIIRADTLDLQNHDAPSAKDHSRQPTHPAPLGEGPPAPHQSLSLRNAEQEAMQEQANSPRASEDRMGEQNGTEEQEYYEEPEQMNGNGHMMHQNQNGAYRRNAEEETLNGGYNNAGDETLVGDQDVDDDDMMDKISSSPSIDDGGYPLPHVKRTTSGARGTNHPQSPMSAGSLPDTPDSSSPFTAKPKHLPLPPLRAFRMPSNTLSPTSPSPNVFRRPSNWPTTIAPRQFSPLSSSCYSPDTTPNIGPSNVSVDHHQSQGGYEDRKLSRGSSTDSLASVASSESSDTDSVASSGVDYAEKARRMLESATRGHNRDYLSDASSTGSDSDSDSDSDDDEEDCKSMNGDETTWELDKGELNNMEDFLLPENDELLDDWSDTEGMTDDDSSDAESEDSEMSDSYQARHQKIKKARQNNYHLLPSDYNPLDPPPREPQTLVIFSNNPQDDDDTIRTDWHTLAQLYSDPLHVGYGWHASCLQYAEDIDFEFVYALHTFVATVEGQANCTKGDTMVLLDDSNSYWWLVRVVKDGSIGYLPAEHIETPTERLARLNKHRNIDLAQTMLGDNPEKSKNPLKKAMKRRNAKTVQFAAPTYVEPSDVDYSSEEEAGDQMYGDQVDPQTQGQDNQGQQVKSAIVEPLKIKTAPKAGQQPDSGDDMTPSPEKARADELLADKQEGSSPRSRNGVLRNTDSFFKDDSAETRKISLTPNLLRDDSSKDIGDKELKTRGSLETFEKIASPTERTKDEKRRKDKKPGMLSGLFKRKDRKSKIADDEVEEPEKTSEDSLRKESPDSSSQEARSSKTLQVLSPQRVPSKLQKSPPADTSPVRTTGFQNTEAQASPNTTKVSPTFKENDSPMLRRVPMEEQQQAGQTDHDADNEFESDDSPKVGKRSVFSAFNTPPEPSGPPATSSKPNQRFAMDDFETPEEVEKHQDHPTESTRSTTIDRLSESPVQVSPVDARGPHEPPGLIVDTSSQEEPLHSPSSPASSTEIIEPRESKYEDATETPASTATSSAPTPTWSDASLRAYMDSDQEIKDLITIVHDTTGVQPAGPDHPVIGPLYREERVRLAELSQKLDRLHRDYLDRKKIIY